MSKLTPSQSGKKANTYKKPRSLESLWGDVEGKFGDKPIWEADDAGQFMGYSGPMTVVKNRSLKIGPIGSIPWFRFGRTERCVPKDLAEAVNKQNAARQKEKHDKEECEKEKLENSEAAA